MLVATEITDADGRQVGRPGREEAGRGESGEATEIRCRAAGDRLEPPADVGRGDVGGEPGVGDAVGGVDHPVELGRQIAVRPVHGAGRLGEAIDRLDERVDRLGVDVDAALEHQARLPTRR